MGYIRTKYIAGKPYAYFVECKGKKQKVKAYLGRVFESSFVGERKNVSGKSKKEFLTDFIGQVEIPPSVVVDGLSIVKGKKNVVVKLNDGYLCTFTLKRILTFKSTDDLQKDGELLARYFMDAGLTIRQEEFVEYYEKC
jgi:hypothetical protein